MTLRQTAAALDAGRTSSRALVEACLAAIAAPEGEGRRTFVSVDETGARAAADAMDALWACGHHPSRLAGIPISVKDLFDVRGQPTRAGSLALEDAPLAHDDAPAIARLRQAGLVIIGRTTMTEFAYSGLGINKYVGTPLNPWDRAVGRIPGGSSSGAAVSVTDGMAAAAIGTDTGGSTRIPAALTGIAGWKPTQRRVPLAGAVPLSPTLDSIGPLGPSIDCCALLDAVMAGEGTPPEGGVMPAARLRLALPQAVVLEGLDAHVAADFERALGRLRAAGAEVVDVGLEVLAEIPAAMAKGGFAAAEAYAWHAPLIADRGNLYDPIVRMRIERGSAQTARDYIELVRARRDIMGRVAAGLAGFDGLVFPTVPIVAPPLAGLDEPEAYMRTNLVLLRNPSLVNFLDGCAACLPMHRPGDPPTGLTIAGLSGRDATVLAIASWAEEALGRGAGAAP